MPSGIIQGASYADAHARMPAALALTAAALVAAGLAGGGRGDRPLARLLIAAAGALRRHDARPARATPRCCSALP